MRVGKSGGPHSRREVKIRSREIDWAGKDEEKHPTTGGDSRTGI
jgi:hypothetical protein